MELLKCLKNTGIVFKFDGESFQLGQMWFNDMKRFKKAARLENHLLMFAISSHLVGNAEIWWRTVEDKVNTWEEFEVEFQKKYLQNIKVEAWKRIRQLKQKDEQNMIEFVLEIESLFQLLNIENDACKASFLIASAPAFIAQELEKENWENQSFRRLAERAVDLEEQCYADSDAFEASVPVNKHERQTKDVKPKKADQVNPRRSIQRPAVQQPSVRLPKAQKGLNSLATKKKAVSFCMNDVSCHDKKEHQKENQEKDKENKSVQNSSQDQCVNESLKSKEPGSGYPYVFNGLYNMASSDEKFVKQSGHFLLPTAEAILSRDFILKHPDTTIIVNAPTETPSILFHPRSFLVSDAAIRFPDGSVSLTICIQDIVLVHRPNIGPVENSLGQTYYETYVTLGIPCEVFDYIYKIANTEYIHVHEGSSREKDGYRWINVELPRQPLPKICIPKPHGLQGNAATEYSSLPEFMKKIKQNLTGLGGFRINLKTSANTMHGIAEIGFLLCSFQIKGFSAVTSPPSSVMRFTGMYSIL